MSKDIKEYLHYYLGSECKFGVIVPGQETIFYGQFVDTRVIHNVHNGLAEVKLILRPLASMTEDEASDCNLWSSWKLVNSGREIWNTALVFPETLHYLLSKGFDIFGLIEAEIAIDKTKI